MNLEARLRHEENRRYRLIDVVVETLGAEEFYSRDVGAQLYAAGPRLWNSVQDAQKWATRWLRAAEERGELRSRVLPANSKRKLARRYYRRAS